MKTLHIIWLFILTVFAVAGSEQQTDWSGGEGVLGPVISWSNEYYADINARPTGFQSSLMLDFASPIKNLITNTFNGPWCVYPADIDGDGDMDVTFGVFYGDAILWAENIDGEGLTWSCHTVAFPFDSANAVYAYDIDLDGDMDILGTSYLEDLVVFFENENGTGSNWNAHVIDDDFTNPLAVCPGDIDSDGDIDVVGVCGSLDDVVWWENEDGTGTEWKEHKIAEHFNGACSVIVTDLDGDSDNDVLASAYTDGVAWWENYYGSGIAWLKHEIPDGCNGTNQIATADFDDDGDLDIAGVSVIDDAVIFIRNCPESEIGWNPNVICSDLNYALTVTTDDVDGDGDFDIIAAGKKEYEIRWWENTDGYGYVWTERMVDDYVSAPYSVKSGDINGDGNTDIVGCAVNSDQVAWWDIVLYQPNGSLQSSILDMQEHPEWLGIDWNSNEPYETWISFQVRLSDDPTSMGDWSDVITEPCFISDLVSDGDHFLQYRVLLATTIPRISPALDDVTLSWDPTGIGGDPEFSFYLRGVDPNPASDHPDIRFGIPERSQVEIAVFDISGRIVSLCSNVYDEGEHCILLEGLNSGIYFVQMLCNGYCDYKSFVVMR